MVIVMNVIQASRERADDVQAAFVARERNLAGVDGFVSLDLLRRVEDELEDGPAEFVVATRWTSYEAFEAWIDSDAFFDSHAHRDPTLTQSIELRTYEVLAIDPAATAR